MTAQETTKEKLKHIKEMINNRIVVNSLEELRALNGENLNVYLYMDKADLSTEDLSNISHLKLKEGSTVTFSYNDFLQTNVIDYVATSLPKHIDASNCKHLILNGCTIKKDNEIDFPTKGQTSLKYAKIYRDLDLSNCPKVNLSHASLGNNNLKFQKNADIDLSYARQFPEKLDVSMCSGVNKEKQYNGKITYTDTVLSQLFEKINNTKKP